MLELGWLASWSRAVPRAGSGSPPHPSASSGPHPVLGPVTLGGLCLTHRAALFFSFPSPIQGWRRPNWGGRVKCPAQPGLRPWPGLPRAVIASLLWQRDQGRAGGGGRRGWKRPAAPVGPQGLPAPTSSPAAALALRAGPPSHPTVPRGRCGSASAGAKPQLLLQCGALMRVACCRGSPEIGPLSAPFLSPPDRDRRGRSGPRPLPRDSERQRQGC